MGNFFLDSNDLGWRMVGGKGEGEGEECILFVSEDGAGEKEGGHAGFCADDFLLIL